MAAPTGLTRRRHRGSGFRDSPDEEGAVEMQEAARLRDRKKKRERERERERERDERSSRNKRRRGDRLIHAGNREDGPADSTDESVNGDEEEDYDDEGGGGGSLRMPPASTSSPLISNHHLNHQPKSFPQSVPSTKIFRPAASAWKPADEMIGVSVPRKARSVSTKRAHDCWVSGSGGDQLHRRQPSTSPTRSSLVSATASPSRISPSSSNREKMKPNRPNKHRTQPKTTSSSNQDEIEFEIAQVLYGLMKQAPANEPLNRSTSDSKSRASSPASTPATQQSSVSRPLNGLVVTVPKRNKPRPVNYGGDENVPFHSQTVVISKLDMEQKAKAETMPPKKNLKPGITYDTDLEQSGPEYASEQKADPMELKINNLLVSKNFRPEPVVAGLKDEDASSAKRDSSGQIFDDNSRQLASELGIKREEKFQIDLMAPPPALRLSPEKEGKIETKISFPDELKPLVKDADKTKLASDESMFFFEQDQKRLKRGIVEESKPSFSKDTFVELHLNTKAKKDGESGMSTPVANRQLMHKQQQPPQPPLSRVHTGNEATGDKTVFAASSLPSAMTGWQGALPPLGYMAPLQGVVLTDGSTVISAPIQPPRSLLNQPRPKRCATHCYIARNIFYHQQFSRMNPFWPAAAGSAPSLYGANPCNLNVVPPLELNCSSGVRGVNPVNDKSLDVIPGTNTSKDKPSQGPNIVDTAHKKQILLQQSVPAGTPNNLLRGPAFIFPLSQPSVAGAAPTANQNSISGNTTMSFNYPNMAANETQYLAIMQNNPYHFPFPTHAGAQPVYRGAHPQAMPFFNGSFYSPQMLHPSQLQQQPLHSAHGHLNQPGQNTGISSGSSSSQKNMQNHSHKSPGNGNNGGITNLKQSFPSPKNLSSQLPLQQQNQHLTEAGNEDSPSTADSRGSRSNLGMYSEGRNFPNHVQNFAQTSISSLSVGGGTNTNNGVTNGNHHKNGKKLLQQRQGLKVGVDSAQSHQGFAVSFGSLTGDGGGPPALDITSMGQTHAILQNFPDAARHSYQVMASAAQQAQQNKNCLIVDEVRKGGGGGGDASNVEEERKSMVTKGGLSNVGLSIAFSRSDLADSSVPGNNVDSSSKILNVGLSIAFSRSDLADSSFPGNNVDSSSKNLIVGPGPGSINSLNSRQQQLLNQQQQQQKSQFIQLHKQPQQFMASAATGKTPSKSNGNLYPDHLPTNAAVAVKLTNPVTCIQHKLAPISGGSSSSSSPAQSPQWKNSARTSLSQVPPSTLASSNSASIKSHYQQRSHMQISFGSGNPKSLTAAQGQQHLSGHQGPAQIMVVSPAAASNYKNGGSPKTTTGSMVTNKALQASVLSPSAASLQVKNSTMPSQNSSPVGARNPASHGSSNMGMSQGNSGSKPQMLQQQQHMKPQISKQAMQQFPSYLHTSEGPNSTSLNAGNHQRRRPENHSIQQSQSPCASSSKGMLSMCSSAGAVTSDPAKAIAAAAASNTKAPPSQGTSQPSGQQQHVPTGYPHLHVASAVVQDKLAQRKQQTGE
ncbi:unnamed protein product [Rhodiola kirilowii]